MVRYQFNDYSLKDSDIHPEEIFAHEKSLAREFLKHHEISSSKEGYLSFEQVAYEYDSDDNLIAQIDVSDFILNDYFNNSELSKFRSSEHYQKTVSTLRKGIWKQQVEWIEGRCFRYFPKASFKVLDVGSKYVGWIEELKSLKNLETLSIARPLLPILSTGISGDYDLIVAFDVLQREKDPSIFLKELYRNLSSEGIAVLTTRSGTGFDILALGKETESLYPFDHLFLPSPAGLRKILENNGFEVLELTTPGVLDVELVKASLKNSSSKLVQYLIHSVDSERLQAFIQQNNISSHMRVVIRKVRG